MKKKLKSFKEILKSKFSLKKNKKIKEKCSCKYRKYIYSVSVILFIYFVFLIFAKNINAFLIFPEIFLNPGKKLEVNYIDGKKDKVIFYFAGNSSLKEINYFKDIGYKIFIFDYTENIKNNFEIKYEEINEQAEEFYNLLISKEGVSKDDVIVFGKEKGSVFASNFALRNNIKELILLSPVSSFYNFSEDKVGFIFHKLFFINDFNTKNILRNFYNKSLLISSNTYKYFNQSKNIFRDLEGEKYFVEMDFVNKEDLLNSYSSFLKEFVRCFINGTKIKNKYNFIDKQESQNMLEEIEYNRIFNNVDLFTDSSLTKFVNNKVPFQNIGYIPKNLVSIGAKHIIDSKGGTIKARKILKVNLEKMANDFFEETKNNIVVVSAYRGYLYQKGIKDRGCPDNLCAKAGYSEHQSGLAIDLYSASSNRNWANDNTLRKYYKWLSNNAHKYGFTNTYQKGIEVDGYDIEPWHWRYVGKDLATLLKENNLTFAEFYNQKKLSDNY
ncbi:hypothetical protein CSB07_00640 [Candidatus Gracilibacteria bacterium]|nr:MAG: hypothetical protein CSB07_00640 [Candidatus Gracilibacteria bacterium]PIE84936.1 MAG: hypothetical protein CSA08_04630 [Candidatus Gracilibacteria bacterium]